ncbi:MAG: tryptophan 7-halogenase [Pseudomonadota bacterium]
MTDRVQSVVVVGRDAPLWLASAAVQRALGPTGVKVRAVELDSQLAQVDAYAALPSLALLHRILGLEERLVLDVGNGVPMVGQRFSNWAKGATPFLLAYDDEPPPGGDLPFVQYWTKGAMEGLRVGFDHFSLGSACARLNNVPVPGPGPAPLSASYGYHLDATSYSQLVKQLAVRLGVEPVSVGVSNIDVSGESITGLDLADGSRVSADLYIDASGREALLISRLDDAKFESWGDWLPCDRLLALSGPRLGRLPAFSQISAFQAGWVGLLPLKDRTAVIAAYDSTSITAPEVVELVGVVAGMPITGDAVVSELRPGIQRSPWIGNCVAIGEAAIALEPLDAVQLQLTHGCISHLITLFPATAAEFPEAAAYNEAIRSFGSNLRDFQAAHYALNRRFDEPMWDRVRERQLPSSLRRKVDIFGARALMAMNDDESFHEQLWAALLLGCGEMPEGYDPRVDSLSDQAHMAKVQERLRAVAEEARLMPSAEQFLNIDQGAAAPVSA